VAALATTVEAGFAPPMGAAISTARASGQTHLPLRRVAAVGVGNALAFYDFLTFSFFAIQIGRTFFPDHDHSASLLKTLAAFGVGFLARPVGGFVLGRFGDRAGRRPAMIVALTLMGVGIVGVALTPGCRQIGLAAPILLVLFRLIQGFAIGGEVGPSTAYLTEAAPPRRRGIYLALQFATQDVAVFAAGLVGTALGTWLAPADLDAWGWRAAFLVGAAIVPVGLAMRRSLPETHSAAASARSGPVRRESITKLAVLGAAMLGMAMISAYVLDYTTTYAQDTLHMAAGAALGATAVIGASSIVNDILAGLLTDKLGRKPVMIGGAIAFLLLVTPAYMLMVRFPSVPVVYAVAILIAALVAFSANPALIALSEALPRSARSAGVGTIYAMAVLIFGSSAQFMAKWLQGVTGSPIAPAWYVMAALIMGLTAMLFMPETAPVRTGDDADH
jgi:MFS family permease